MPLKSLRNRSYAITKRRRNIPGKPAIQNQTGNSTCCRRRRTTGRWRSDHTPPTTIATPTGTDWLQKLTPTCSTHHQQLKPQPRRKTRYREQPPGNLTPPQEPTENWPRPEHRRTPLRTEQMIAND